MLLVPTLMAVTLSLADTSGAEVRSLPVGNGAALDLYTSPFVRLSLLSRRSSFALGYVPRLTWVNVTREHEFALMHRADAAYAWWTKRLRLSLGVGGSLGRQTFINVTLAQTNPTPDPAAGAIGGTAGTPPASAAATFLPRQEIVQVGSLSVSTAAAYMFSRRWSGGLGITYEVSGGLGDSAEFVPLRRGPSAGGVVSTEVTRRDTLSASVGSSVTDLPARDSRFVTISTLESWAHRLALRTRTRLGAGASYLQSRSGEERAERSVLAGGVASISHGFDVSRGGSVELSADGQLGTSYNPVLGTVSQAVSANAGASFTEGRLSLGANGRLSQTLPVGAENAAFGVGAGVLGSYQIVEPVRFQTSASWSRQVFPNSPLGSGANVDQWSASVALTVIAPAISL